jgi:hypothetical protein
MSRDDTNTGFAGSSRKRSDRVEPLEDSLVLGMTLQFAVRRGRVEQPEHLFELVPMVLAVVIGFVQHDLDARQSRVAGLDKGSVAVVTLGFEAALWVENHRIDGVDWQMNERFREIVHERILFRKRGQR